MSRFIPETPGGSVLADLEASTEEQAWKNLEAQIGGIYPNRKAMKARGYRVVEYKAPKKKGKM